MVSSLLNNRYAILDTLASGGFGCTYLAEDTHLPSRRRCVIKQLQLSKQTPNDRETVRERFEREAAVLESLGAEHPQIPQLYAYFCEDGQFYLVQEWIDGQTLAESVRQSGVWSERAVRELLRQILPVFDYTHARRIIHRDIKPENIILRHHDRLPVIIDFGAVKEAVTAVDSNSQFSLVIGTPGFMPSEQAAGRPTYSSDFYSLALTAVFLLSGKLPADLPTDERSGDILWRDSIPHLSDEFAAILDRALNFNPRDRFHSAAEMLAALNVSGNSSLNTVVVSPAVPSELVTKLRHSVPQDIPHPKPRRQSQPPADPSIAPSLNLPAPNGLTWAVGTAIVLLGGLIFGWDMAGSRLQPTEADVSTPSPPPRRSSTPDPQPTEATPASSESDLETADPQPSADYLERKDIDNEPEADSPGLVETHAEPVSDPSVPLEPEVLPEAQPEDEPTADFEPEEVAPEPAPAAESAPEPEPETVIPVEDLDKPTLDDGTPKLENPTPEKIDVIEWGESPDLPQ